MRQVQAPLHAYRQNACGLTFFRWSKEQPVDRLHPRFAAFEMLFSCPVLMTISSRG